ncbi:PAS domain S-box protein [Bradyrhizobium sp. UFLA 03-164]|uniref:histidine kinase n=2 Tax=Bradyrhizobium uaiense TaxID=2594946 RepID=A0A6P1BN20_9BRAD|nr:PAS domain S-box protein [Bradyrhizobium uaiense]
METVGFAMVFLGPLAKGKSPGRAQTKAEQALRIVESMPALAWFADVGGRFLYMNRSPRVVTGLPKEDLVPTKDDEFGFRKVVHPDDLDQVLKAWRHSLRTGHEYNCEHRMWHTSRGYRWYRSFGLPTRDPDGRVVGWYGTTIDINELKVAEAALRENERTLQQLIDAVPVLIWSLSPQGDPTYYNRQLIEYTGASAEQMKSIDVVIEAIIHPDDAAIVAEAVQRGIATGEGYSLKHRLRRADGVYRWVDARAEPMRNTQGEIVQWYGVCFDIHGQVLAEEGVRRSERKLQQLIDAVPALIWSTEPDGTPTYVSKRFTEVTGATLEDITAADGKPSLSVVHDDDRPQAIQAFMRSTKEGIPYIQRYRQLRRGGIYRWTETRAEALRDEKGNVIQWYGVSVDIHDMMMAQEAVRQNERQLQLLVDTVPTQIWCVTPEGEPSYINKTMMDYIGMKLEDFDAEGGLRGAIENLVHPDDRDALHRALGHSLRTGETFALRFRNRRRDGVYRWQEGRAEPLRNESGQITRWYGANIDIDNLLATEAALRNSTQQLQQMIDAVPINILSYDPAGRLTSASKRYLENVGTPPDHIQDFEALARYLAHPDDLAAVLRRALDGFATGTPFVNRFRRRDRHGDYPWIEARAQPLRDRSGEIVQWYMVSIDIESEVRTQEELRERERFLWQLVETLPAMIDCASPNGEPIYRSQRLRQFLGYDLESLDGTGKTRLDGTLDAGVHPDDVAGVKERYAHCLATGEPYARRHRLRRFDGEYRWVETRAEAMRSADGTIVQWNVICLDIDGEVRAQEALRFAQERLARASQAASLAELSASIAHEVNQPLAAVIANSHACQRWLTADPPNIDRAHRTVERIIRDANSAADVVSRIRALFKQSVDRRISMTLGDMITEVRELMAEEALRRSVRMEFEVEGGLPPVAVDRVQLQQVLINLIRNGMDAMDALTSGKRLRLRVRHVADTIQTEINDRGRGVEHPDRMFEPFFTTKEHGMGMGLAICRSIVESHGGKLWAETSEPPGATFIFTLPIEPSDAA